MSRNYYVYKSKSGTYIAEILNPNTGLRVCKRNTGTKNRDEAILTADRWIREGIPERKRGRAPVYKKPALQMPEAVIGLKSILEGIKNTALDEAGALQIAEALKEMGLLTIPAVTASKGNIEFITFLEKFWDYEKSEYIQDKLAHGHGFGRSHAHECLKRVRTVLKPFFGNKKLNSVSTDDLSRLARLLAGRGLASSTINQILLICKTPLKWAYNKKMIIENPCIGLTSFAVTNKERGILTEEEAAAVFSIEWKDKRAYAASLVSVTTGARLGECLALRRSDIGKDTVNIAHSYSSLDGLKLPKNNKKRAVPLLPEVKAALLDLLDNNPHGTVDPFIFFSLLPSQPVDPLVIRKGLKYALDKIGVDHKGRNIAFHSWRHYFCSKITQLIESEKAAKVSGHLSEGVFKKYADHIELKNIQEVGAAAAIAFGNILQFKKAV